MPSNIRAVVVDPNAPGRLALREFPAPVPGPSQALVKVHALSLNLGEVRNALTMAKPGWRPGWDTAGVVEQAAADGSGPKAGSRVVCLLPSASWAEQLAVPTNQLAALPDNVSFQQAAALPIAGLTALYALEHYGSVLQRRVLVTGASGGVGHLLLQLARNAGAHVTALVRRAEREKNAREAGAHEVIVGENLSGAGKLAPFDAIFEALGGETLGQALTMLAPNGMCVLFGVSSGPKATFEAGPFMRTGGAMLYGLIVFHILKYKPANEGLARLVEMVAQGQLKIQISAEAPWTEIAAVVDRFFNQRAFAGKVILNL